MSTNNDIGGFEDLQLLSEDVGKLYHNDAYSDVDLIVNSRRFGVHKVILAARSLYFQALFFGPFQERNSKEVHLNEETTVEAFEVVLQYIYNGKMSYSEKSENQILEVLSLANKYGLKRFEDSLLDYITNVLVTPSNVCKIFAFNETLNNEKVYGCCRGVITEHPKQFLESEDLTSLAAQSVQTIFSEDEFLAEEIEIFKAVMRWVNGNSHSNENERNLLLSTVRLQHISRDNLINVVWPSNLINANSIFKAINDQDKKKVKDYRLRVEPGKNFATPRNGAKVIRGTNHGVVLETVLLLGRKEPKCTQYTCHKNNDIVIDLGAERWINGIRILAHLYDRVVKNEYYIEVSLDENVWQRVVDCEVHTSNGEWRDHWFEKTRTKFIRIVGNSYGNDNFLLVSLEALYEIRK